MSFDWTPTQEQARVEALGLRVGGTHALLYGGSRSGKTFLLVWAIVTRALAAAGSRHLIARYRFSHVKNTIALDTFPKVMSLCFPAMQAGVHYKVDKSDWYVRFENGSEIWFGGLDEKERAEKILGAEYATVYLNECSDIPWSSRKLVITRLAQRSMYNDEGEERPLRLKMYYDCNPPAKGHWTYKLFMQKRDPETRQQIPNVEDYVCFGPMNPDGNRQNLAPEYLDQLKQLPARERKRFFEGLWGDESDNALWTIETLEQCRFEGVELPDMQRVVVAIDPSGTKGEEDKRSDEIGLVVCGIGIDGRGYVLEDLSGRMAPADWGKAAVAAYDRWEADCILAETNFGGEMVRHTIRSERPGIPFREVKASRGKVVRAEPVSALFEQSKVMLAGVFPVLEDQLCGMTTAGYVGDRSPDRADAMVWGLTHLFPAITRSQSEFSRRTPRVQLGYEKAKAWA